MFAVLKMCKFMLLLFLQAVVTGYFNFSMIKPNGFYSFYLASLRNLEHDVHKSIVFATITNPTAASRLGINLSNASPHNQIDIRLHLWNETLVRKNAFVTENIFYLSFFLQKFRFIPLRVKLLKLVDCYNGFTIAAILRSNGFGLVVGKTK